MTKHPWLAHMQKTRKAHPEIKDVGKLAKLAKKTYKKQQNGGACEEGDSSCSSGGARRRRRRSGRKGMRGGAEPDETSPDLMTDANDEPAIKLPVGADDEAGAPDMKPPIEDGADAPAMEGGRRRRRQKRASAKKSSKAKKSAKKGGKKSAKKSRKH